MGTGSFYIYAIDGTCPHLCQPLLYSIYDGIIYNVMSKVKREEMFKVKSRAIDSSARPFAITDLEGSFIYINKAFLQMLKCTDEKDIIGKPVAAILKAAEKDVDVMKELCKKGGWAGELLGMKKDGFQLHLQTLASVVKDKSGKPDNIVFCLVDITEREKARRALLESQWMLSALMTNLPGMAYRCLNDEDRTMEFVSAGCLELTGYHFSDLFQNRKVSYGELIRPDDRGPLQREIKSAIEEDRVFKFIYRIKTKQGKIKWVWEQGRTIFSIEEKPLILEGFITDITEQKQMEEELKQAFDKLKIAQSQLIQSEKMGAIGRLASGVAHEVKNPLATMLQGIYFLKQEIPLDNKNVYSVLKRMNNAVERADGIIKGLLDFSRITKMNKKPENLNAVIESAIFLLTNDIRKYHIAVVKEFRSNDLNIRLDKNKIEQVFINLFTNAIQAMSKVKERKLKIKTYLNKTKEGKWVVVIIEDTGVGIPQDNLDKIFDPFFSTKHNIGGTGLGLSIVRNIVQMHNGRIDIQNKNEIQGARAILSFKI